jgi:hypothetical protein
MSSVLGKKDVFVDYEEMSEAIRDQVHTTTVNMQKVKARKTRMVVMMKVATMNLTNLHQRIDKKQIYQVCSKLLKKTVTIMMIIFLKGMMMMMIMMV